MSQSYDPRAAGPRLGRVGKSRSIRRAPVVSDWAEDLDTTLYIRPGQLATIR